MARKKVILPTWSGDTILTKIDEIRKYFEDFRYGELLINRNTITIVDDNDKIENLVTNSLFNEKISNIENKLTIIGIKEENGILYWTINGDFLLNNEEKVRAEGYKGDDGITPKFKIENGLWFVSYNEGETWEELGKATGDQGLQGEQGSDGASAYQIWLDAGNDGSEADFLASLKGQDGADGQDGAEGKSAYQIWLDAGNDGSEADFLASLKGEQGDKGDKGDTGPQGPQGEKGALDEAQIVDLTQNIIDSAYTYANILSANTKAAIEALSADTENAIKIVDEKFDDRISSAYTTFSAITAERAITSQSATTADSANSVSYNLVVGDKTFNGSEEVEITASDLGLSSALKYHGITTTPLQDGSNDMPIQINNKDHFQSAGCVVIYSTVESGNTEFVWNGEKWEKLGDGINYKVKQIPVPNPTADGKTTSFISGIEQDENGVITVTKKNLDTNIQISSAITANHAEDANYANIANTSYSANTSVSAITSEKAIISDYIDVKEYDYMINRTLALIQPSTTGVSASSGQMNIADSKLYYDGYTIYANTSSARTSENAKSAMTSVSAMTAESAQTSNVAKEVDIINHDNNSLGVFLALVENSYTGDTNYDSGSRCIAQDTNLRYQNGVIYGKISTAHTSYSANTIISKSSDDKCYLMGTPESGDTFGSVNKNLNVYMQNGNIFTSSDERVKDFVKDIDVDLDKLSKLPKKYFIWKNDEEKKLQIGTSAQKLYEIYPELVSIDENDKYGVSYEKLSIIALAAVDKLYEENKELKERLKKIEEHLGL